MSTAYGDFARQLIEAGWICWFVTFQNVPMPGGERTLINEMLTSVDGWYRLLLPRLFRDPRNTPAIKLPLMIAVPDVPVHKRDKAPRLSYINEGIHAHALLLLPPTGCRTYNLVSLLTSTADLSRRRCQLLTVKAEPLRKTPEVAADYVLKQLNHRRYDADDIWIFPRAGSELSAGNVGDDSSRGQWLPSDKIDSSTSGSKPSLLATIVATAAGKAK